MSGARRAFAIAVGGVLLAGMLAATGMGAGQLRFTIALPAATYAVGHAIPLELTLTNASSRPVRVNARLAVNDAQQPAVFREVTVDVRTPSGRKAGFHLDIKIGEARAGQLVALAAGRSVRRTVDLARYYNLREPGTYEVRATYASAAKGAPIPPILSNTIKFTLH